MIHTEEAARGKWCPMYRISVSCGETTDNVTHGPPGYCCTTACMAWRRINCTSGYCGLAGHAGLKGEEERHDCEGN